MIRFTHLLRYFYWLPFVFGTVVAKADDGFDWVLKNKAAVSLGKVVFFSDTLLSRPTNLLFEEGELFEIIAESKLEHDDKDQAQRFKWYKLKARNKQIGWVFGDAIAVIEQEKQPESLLGFHQRKWKFDNGFENAICWIAAVNGTEIKTSSALVNPQYNETYLIISNEKGNSVFINLSGQSISGEATLKTLLLQDITGDTTPEIIIERSSFASGSPLENRDVELYAFQAGTLRKIFEERLTLTDGDDTPSPALFKNIEISEKNIRLAYVDFLHCENYKQNIPCDLRTTTQERCLEYVTSTYSWDENKKQFGTLYAESRTTLPVFSKQNYKILSSPSDTAKIIAAIAENEELIAVKLFENFKTVNDKAKPDFWLYVKKSDGTLGYLEAYKIYFDDFENADILHEYFNYAPISRQDWKSNEQFLFFQAKEF
jgi:hypothetical protein